MRQAVIGLTAIGVVAATILIVIISKKPESAYIPAVSKQSVKQETPLNQRIQKPELNNARILVSGNFTRPLWSSDGNKVLLTQEGNLGLYYVEKSNSHNVVQLNNVKGAGYGAAWSHNGESVFYVEKENYKPIVKSISLQTKEVNIHPEIHFSSVKSFTRSNGKELYLILNPQTLQIEAFNPQSGKKWIVTKNEGQFYEPLLSPDHTMVAVHRDAEILVYNVYGGGLKSTIGKGIVSSWSSDNKYLLGFLDESADGHNINNSELYLFTADGSQKWQLTDTEDLTEMWPSWNPVKNEIVFADGKSGQIFIAEIVLSE